MYAEAVLLVPATLRNALEPVLPRACEPASAIVYQVLRGIGEPHLGFPGNVFAERLVSGHVGKGRDEYFMSRAGLGPGSQLLPAGRGDGAVRGHGLNKEQPLPGFVVEHGAGGVSPCGPGQAQADQQRGVVGGYFTGRRKRRLEPVHKLGGEGGRGWHLASGKECGQARRTLRKVMQLVHQHPVQFLAYSRGLLAHLAK